MGTRRRGGLRRGRAVPRARDVIGGYLRLAGDDHTDGELAEQLVRAGTWLYRHGDHQQAVSRLEQAVRVLRPRTAGDPASRPLLAAALDKLADALSNSGRHKAAVEAARDAVTAYQRLADDELDRYRPALAHALTGLGTALTTAGRSDQAAEVVQEAVTICRDLATADAALRPQLAVALTHLALHLSSAERLSDAAVPAGEATRLWRSLPDDGGHHNDRVMALAVHAPVLAHMGRLEEAAATAVEGVAALGRVPDALDRLAAEIADTLVEVVAALVDAHRWDLAAPLLAELTRLQRLLVLSGSDEHVPFLEATLRLYGYGAYEQLDPRQKETLRREIEMLNQLSNRRPRPRP